MARSKFVMPTPRIKRRRAWTDDIQRLWRAHARQVGEVVTAWNDLQGACYEIFATLIESESAVNRATSRGIWHTVQSDSAQRDMMLATANGILSKNTRIYAQIEWLKKSADNLAKHRYSGANGTKTKANCPSVDFCGYWQRSGK